MLYPEPYKRNDLKTYSFVYVDRDGKRKRKSTGCHTKREARFFIKEFMDNLRKGLADVTFREYADPFFVWDRCPRVARKRAENKQIGEEHCRQSRLWLKNHVFKDPSFCNLKIAKTKRGDILDLRNRLMEKASISTVNHAIGTVKTIFSEAYFRGDIEYNPGHKIGAIQPPEEEKREVTVIPIETMKELFRIRPGHFPEMIAYRLWKFYAYTGCRVGEAFALTWNKLDGKILTIDEAFTGQRKKQPKWNKKRKIHLSETILAELDERRKETLYPGPNDYIFCHEYKNRHTRIGYKYLQRHLPEVLDAAGIEEHYTTGDFRHSLNTHLLSAGVDPILVQIYLGWTSRLPYTPVQLKFYTNLDTFNLEPVAKVIDKLYGK